ncbi:MAG: type II toxin-antitoxin system VapB family antitoxin [Bryobacteraceae bacterium]|jgi:hypothetical protein
MENREGECREQFEPEPNRERDVTRVVAHVMEIAQRIAARPNLDPRSPDEIIGYDEQGIPR